MAVLLVIDPGTFVNGSLEVSVLALAVSLVIEPFALKYVTVSMDHASNTMSLAVFPVALVDGSVDPDLLAFSHASF